METIIGALAGAAAYRIRGGGIDHLFSRPVSNHILRSVWALFVTLSLPLGWHSPFIFALAFLGVLFGYFEGEFNLAKKENRVWRNYCILSARGAFIMLPLALTYGSLYSQLWLAAAFGLLFVPCYLADIPLKKYVNMYQNWGEVLLGFVIGGALWL